MAEKIKIIYSNSSDTKDDKDDLRILKADCIKEAQEQLNKLTITPATMQYIVKCAYRLKSKKHPILCKNKQKVLELLYNYNECMFLSVFRKKMVKLVFYSKLKVVMKLTIQSLEEIIKLFIQSKRTNFRNLCLGNSCFIRKIGKN